MAVSARSGLSGAVGRPFGVGLSEIALAAVKSRQHGVETVGT